MSKKRSFGAEIAANRQKGHELSLMEKGLIVDRLSLGFKNADVARQFRVHPSIISRIWSRYKTTKSIENKPRSGRPMKLTDTEKRHVIITAKRNRKITWKTLSNSVGGKVSKSTLRRTLQQHFRRKWRSKNRIYLSPITAKKRLEFARLWMPNVQDLIKVAMFEVIY